VHGARLHRQGAGRNECREIHGAGTDDLAILARKAARWAADSEEFLPSNRVADNWGPLLAIADAAGKGMAGPHPGSFCEGGIQG
jgi:hypothetical protein